MNCAVWNMTFQEDSEMEFSNLCKMCMSYHLKVETFLASFFFFLTFYSNE